MWAMKGSKDKILTFEELKVIRGGGEVDTTVVLSEGLLW